jgi:hypothetical protein
MGTWGFSVLSDDTARDVYDEYIKAMNRGDAPRRATREVKRAFSDSLGEEDEAAVVWLALARAQWDYGAPDPGVLKRVERIVRTGEGMQRWVEAGPKSAGKRKKALAEFLAKLRTANPRPRKPRAPVKKWTPYQGGDCLAIRLSDGGWGAALVLKDPPESARAGADTGGVNLVGLLEYKSRTKPDLAVFRGRRWLKFTDDVRRGERCVYNVVAQGHANLKDDIEVVANIPLLGRDPATGRSYTRWHSVEKLVRQLRRSNRRR